MMEKIEKEGKGAALVKEYPVLRFGPRGVKEDLDPVLAEATLELYVDGTYGGTLTCMPEYLEEMILGKLYTEGRISSLRQVGEVKVSREQERADVRLVAAREQREEPGQKELPEQREEPGRKELPGQREEPGQKELPGQMKPLPDLKICPEDVLALSEQLLSSSRIFTETGNVHCVMLCCGAAPLYICEDLDRYHAFEKAVGRALKDKVDFSRTAIYTTGRIPGTIARMAIRAGIPAIVSRSAPTDRTLELAQQYNLTVIGFARRDRMNVYHWSLGPWNRL